MKKNFLDLPILSRLRRNHSLEHATLHVLEKKFPKTGFGGISSPLGFTIVGNVTTENVAEAAIEALKRLRAGESHLVIHQNCGTNFAVTGVFAGLGAWLGTIGAGKRFRQKLERLPLMITLATLALIIAKPLAPWVQKQITTTGDPQGLDLVKVETTVRAGLKLHLVTTKG
jgi:hypothetical protein